MAFNRMYDLTNTREEITEEHTEATQPSFESLRLIDISFRFKGQRRLFERVDLDIRKGELVGIIGYSGIGKSTLLQIVQGLYEPDGGHISLNGQVQEHLRSTVWKKTYATVPQDIKLFNGNVYSNVVIDRPCAMEEFHHFCQSYGFDRFFGQWPMGYLTPVGDDGVKLSGGQKQVLALARALYKRPQVLLLDEATSAMDAHTEAFMLDIIHRLKVDQSMAILFITHRSVINTIADRLYTLEDGVLKIVSAEKEKPTV